MSALDDLSLAEFAPLMELVRRGDQRAAAELVRRYEPEVRRFIRFRLSTPALRRTMDSLDICQSVLFKFFVEVSDPIAGLGCSESFTVTLVEPPLPVIEVVEVFPPSSPGAMDASAFVEVTTPGQLPYAVYVDGFFSFTVNQNNFFLNFY